MFKFLATLGDDYYPRTYVIADTDRGSEAKAIRFEDSLGRKFNIRKIPRSREVGQSYLTSIFTTLYSLLSSYWIFLQGVDLVLTNGPGTCVPVVIWSWAYKILLNYRCKIVLMESYACVKKPSLSAKILYPFVDKYFVQWPSITHEQVNLLGLTRQSKIVYTGRIPLDNLIPKEKISHGLYPYYLNDCIVLMLP